MSVSSHADTNKSRQGQASAHGPLDRLLTFIDLHPLYILALIMVLGIAVSVAMNLESLPPDINAGENDSWWSIALNLVHGHGYSLCLTRYFPFCGPSNQVTAAREPLPVFLFAAVARLSGGSLWAATFVEFLIYLAVLILIYVLTREWASTRAALFAAFLWALYVPAIELIPQVSGDLLSALLVTVGILFTLRARRSHRVRDWLFAGLGLGLAVVARSGTLVIAAIVIAGVFLESWRTRLGFKETIRAPLILSSLVILLMMPWVIRNKIAFGRPVLGSSLIGYNLYRHNYMLGTSDYFRYVGGEEGLSAIQALVARRTDLTGQENEAQMDLVYRGEALQIIRSHPVQYLSLSAYRFLPLWFNWGYFSSYDVPMKSEDKAIMVYQGALLILALIGLIGNMKRAWPLWGSILVITLVYMAVDSQLLYLMPVMPLVMSLSAVGGTNLIGKLFPSTQRSAA